MESRTLAVHHNNRGSLSLSCLFHSNKKRNLHKTPNTHEYSSFEIKNAFNIQITLIWK